MKDWIYKLYNYIVRRIEKIIVDIYYFINHIIEKKQGLDLSRPETLESIGLNSIESESYETTKIFELKRWLKLVPLNIDFVAIDFGSGKGTVVLELAKHKNFKKIYGVELSEKLSNISKKNIYIKKTHNIEILTMNAIETPTNIINEANFFFFYNPFPFEVFEKVFEKIKISIQSYNREVVIIYFNAQYKSIIEKSGLFESPIIYRNILSSANTLIYKTDTRNLNEQQTKI